MIIVLLEKNKLKLTKLIDIIYCITKTIKYKNE